MDQRLISTVHNLPSEPSSRVADLTMDVMIPDEIKPEPISGTNLDRQKANVETCVKFKTREETTMTMGQTCDEGSVAVKVEPVLNTYMANMIEYGTRKGACAVKTGPMVDVSMTSVGDEVEDSRYGFAKSNSKWSKDIVETRGNGIGNVGLVMTGEETDAAMKCENGLTFPVKAESGVVVETAGNQSRTPGSMMYPIKMESELDLRTDIIKDEGENSVGETKTVDSHLYADATVTAAQRLGSITPENIHVFPDMYPPATALAQCSVPAAVRFVPDKMVSNMSETVKKVMDSTVKRLCSVKFVQNVPGAAASAFQNQKNLSAVKAAPVATGPVTSLRKTFNGENRAHPGFQNPCQVLSNVPAGMRSTAESHLKSQMKTLFPAQILPHLPFDTGSVCQAQSQTGLKRIIPFKTAQHMPAAGNSMANGLMESPVRRFTPDRIMSMSTEVSVISPVDFGIKPKPFRKPRKEKLEVKKDVEFEILPVNPVLEKNVKLERDASLNELEIPEMPPEVAAELTGIARAIRSSTKTAAELVREHGPRVKELWKACSTAFKKPGVKGKTNRRQEFKAWVMSAGEPGIYIMKTIAKSVADYTRKRREKIKQLAEAGDPVALEVFSRVLENRRKFIERRRALREAGGPAAMAMAQRARERERMRRARKALLKSGNYCRDNV